MQFRFSIPDTVVFKLCNKLGKQLDELKPEMEAFAKQATIEKYKIKEGVGPR